MTPQSTRRVAVVVPAHCPQLRSSEVLSLRRLAKVLPQHHKLLVYPSGMDAREYVELLPGLELRAFDPSCFKSVRSYSRMLRTPAFYAAFAQFEFVLIHQVDCYLFSDRLAEFLVCDYDYVGAPWTNFDWLTARVPALGALPVVTRWLSPVGNGGLSLRRVSVFHRLARRFHWLGARIDINEDLYWCQLVARLSRLRLASLSQALRFAFEFEPARCYELTGHELPFGCHAFERYDFAFWRRHLDPAELRAAGL